jgi:hypothetical protein
MILEDRTNLKAINNLPALLKFTRMIKYARLQ